MTDAVVMKKGKSMKTRMKVAAIVLAGCMLLGNLQITAAQENTDPSGEIPVSAELEEGTLEMLPDPEQTGGSAVEGSETAEETAPVSVDVYSGTEVQPDSEEESLEEIIIQEDSETADEMQEEELELIPAGEETESAGIVFGQEYSGYISEEEPLQKYEFTIDHDGSVQITAKARIVCVQYSIIAQDEAVCWTAAPEWDPETEYSEITETVELAAGTYSFAVGQTEAYAGEYTFRIEAESAGQEPAAEIPEIVEESVLAEENAADTTEEDAAEENAADTAEEAAAEEDAADAEADQGQAEETAADEDQENDTETEDSDEEEAAEAFPDATLLQGGRNKYSAETIKFGEVYTGNVSSSQPEHWYKFTLTTDCNLDLYAYSTIGFVWYNVYDADNNDELLWYKGVSRDDSSSYSSYETEFTASKGTYYFVVEKSGSYTGAFSFAFDVPVSGVKMNKTSLIVAPGKTATLKATVSPSNATEKGVTWKSSNTAVATVSSSGVVTGKKKGTATITATTKDGGKKATCKVTVGVPVTGVKLNKTKQTLKVNQKVTLKATISPSNATNKKVTWKSSNTSVATVSSSGVVTGKKGGTAKITVTTADGKKVATCTVTVNNPSVTYRTHVQTYGWQGWKKDGAMSGTEGKAKRLEGINIKLTNAPYSGGITYRTHVQTYGWQGWRSNGAMSGTSGQAKRLEAIQIKLTGEMAKHYDIYYRVHAQRLGWMAWAKNGAQAGTAGYAFRLEGIQIVLVKKGGSAPSNSLKGYARTSDMAFTDAKVNRASVSLDFNYESNGPDIVKANCYYSGSTMVVNATVYNTQRNWAEKYNWLTIDLYDKNGSKFYSKTFYNVPLYLSGYATKQMTFNIEYTPIKNINSSKGGGLYMNTDFSYRYRR